MTMKRDYYRQEPRIPIMWQNIGVGVLALAVLGIIGYVILT